LCILLFFGHFNRMDIVSTEFLEELVKTIRDVTLLQVTSLSSNIEVNQETL